jgi:hypothetical protein
MLPVDKKDIHVVPEGTLDLTFAKDQPEYLPLPALVTPDGRVISTWEPTPGDLALLNAGSPLTLVVWHGAFVRKCDCGREHSNLLRPVQLVVGGVDARG